MIHLGVVLIVTGDQPVTHTEVEHGESTVWLPWRREEEDKEEEEEEEDEEEEEEEEEEEKGKKKKGSNMY